VIRRKEVFLHETEKDELMIYGFDY